MKTPTSSRTLLLAALLAALPACSQSRREADGGPRVDPLPRYVVGVDREFPPYGFVDSAGRVAGYSVDLTRAVAEVMGFEIELRAGTWDEIVAGLERGEIDVIPHLSPTEALEERFAFTLPHLEASDAIFVRQEATSLFTEAHIHDLPTLVWQAAAVAEPLRTYDIAENILDEGGVARTLRRLAAGEGDCALVPHLTGLELVRDLKLRNLRIAGPPIASYTRSLSFAVRRADRELLEALDEGLTLVTTTDRYPEIYNAWFGASERSVPRQALIAWVSWVSVPLLTLAALVISWNASLRRTVARRTAAQKHAEEERRKLEAQMQQAQKLESLGVLAGGIAHDFNNLLTGILGNTSLALLGLDPASPARARLRDVEVAGRRAAELCQQMLAYSGRGKFVVEPLDLSRLVRDMTQLLEVSIPEGAVLEEKLAADLPAFEADAAQIGQVVMNLITNASEALGEEGGTITVRTGVESCDEACLRRTFLAEELAVGDYVFLEVADTGSGMDAETRERIFDPFFSTKFTGRGLGLAATLGIVRGHRGALEVESAPGEGTVVRVLFPVSTARLREVREAIA